MQLGALGRYRPIRRKCLISFHEADLEAVKAFIDEFGSSNFIRRAITEPSERVRSRKPAYVNRVLRERLVQQSTVTIVLVGAHTWSRRYVDSEVYMALRAGHGLMAISLTEPSLPALPSRVAANVQSGYARFYTYPSSATALGAWIEDAFAARTQRSSLRRNAEPRRLRSAPVVKPAPNSIYSDARSAAGEAAKRAAIEAIAESRRAQGGSRITPSTTPTYSDAARLAAGEAAARAVLDALRRASRQQSGH
jgi:hypothetical protein